MRRLRGGVKLAGVRDGAAAAFYSVVARREQKKERNRSLGSLRCSCARWKESWGSAVSSPRRRRGGGREEVLGAWHGLERASAKPKSGGEGPRDAWATEHDELMAGKAGKPLHGAGVGAVGGRRRKTEQGVEVEDKGSFAISKNSRDPTVKQR